MRVHRHQHSFAARPTRYDPDRGGNGLGGNGGDLKRICWRSRFVATEEDTCARAPAKPLAISPTNPPVIPL